MYKHILDTAVDPFIRNVNIILLAEAQVLFNQEQNMQNRLEDHHPVMPNEPIHRIVSRV